MEWDDKIHKALVNPIRRRIIERLQEKDLSFQELLGCLGARALHVRELAGSML